MTNFEYTARTDSGDKVMGLVEADNEVAALRTLQEQRLFPIEVVSKASGRNEGKRTGRLRARDLGIMYGQLADLLRAGVPLLKALDSLTRASVSRGLKARLHTIRDAVADGQSLTQALRDDPTSFPVLHTAMIQAGERASFLEDVLSSLSVFIERLDELRGKVRGALIYPALLSALGAVVMVAALLFFVPKFEPLLEGIDKPAPTVLIFGLSTFVRVYWPVALLAGAALVVCVVLFTNSAVGRDIYERWRLRIPVVGTALRMVAITRFCRILGTMLANGVPLLQALNISKDSIGSPLLAQRVEEAAENVRGGASLSAPLGRGGLFPPEILAMISVAEESNQLQNVLIRIADTVEQRTNRQVDQAVRLLEPVVLCVVAMAIGFLALGLLLPIFTLASSLGAQ